VEVSASLCGRGRGTGEGVATRRGVGRVRGLLGDEDREVRYWAARVLVAEEEREGG